MSMIRTGLLSPAERLELEACVRRQREDHGIARRANAMLLLDDGKSCQAISEFLYLDDDTIRGWYKTYREGGWDALALNGWKGGHSQMTQAEEAALCVWLEERFCRSTVEIRAHISADRVGEVDAVHPEYQSKPAFGWVKAGSNPAVLSTAGRGRVNIHGAVNLETFDTPFVEPTTVDGGSAVQLLAEIEKRNPDKRLIHVVWDNAAYHKGPDVRTFLARTTCRIHLIQLPPYCPHLNPIERLWAVLHQYVTHNRYYRSQKQFADAILAFMRETIPREWKNFRDTVSDNFRVITHEKFPVLE